MENLKEVTEAFSYFEEQAELKIKQLNEGLDYMRQVRGVYENLCKTTEYHADGEVYIIRLPERKLLAAPADIKLCAANLWRYHDLFYRFLGDKTALFTFTDKAAVYNADGESRLVAECVRYDNSDSRVITLPAGDYLCAVAADADAAYAAIKNYADGIGRTVSGWHIDEIIINGILCWKYCVQALLI